MREVPIPTKQRRPQTRRAKLYARILSASEKGMALRYTLKPQEPRAGFRVAIYNRFRRRGQTVHIYSAGPRCLDIWLERPAPANG